MMQKSRFLATAFAIVSVLGTSSSMMAQTSGQKESFTAVAVANNNLASGVGTVLIDVTRWSTEAEQKALAAALNKGPEVLLDALQDSRPTGTIRTPDSIAYDLRFAHESPGEDGGRRIVLATDRPIGFWEARARPRTIDYPFTVIQMQIGPDGKGKGTLSYATKIVARGNVIELENFATSPVMLTEIKSEKRSK
ncbi:MAG: hypothetical protein ACRD1U_05680 [Vicinamibacterales bacterium]